jgi:hypothetical protein
VNLTGPQLEAALRRWYRRATLWPVLVALLSFAANAFYLWPGGPWTRGYDALLSPFRDEGTMLYDGLRIAQGEVIYRDFFQFPGPVFFELYGALFRFTGPSMFAARFLSISIVAVGAALLALVVSRFAGRLAGIAAGLFHPLVLYPTWPFAYPSWLALPITLGAVALLAREAPTPRQELAAGGLLALSLLTVQSLGIPTLVAGIGTSVFVGLAARDWRQALARAGRVAGGAAAVAALVVMYFLARGALGKFLVDVFIWPFKHYAEGQGAGLNYAYFLKETLGFQKYIGDPWKSLVSIVVYTSAYLPFATLPAAALALVSVARTWRGQRPPTAPVVAAGMALAAVSPLATSGARRDITHIAFVASFGIIALAVCLAWIVARWRRARLAPAVLFGVLALVAATSWIHKAKVTWARSRAAGTFRDAFVEQYKPALEIERLTRPEDEVVVGWLGGWASFFTGRRSASPVTYFTDPNRGGPYVFTPPSQWRELGQAILTRKPRLLMMVGNQWHALITFTPEIAARYQQQGFDHRFYLRLDPKPAVKP